MSWGKENTSIKKWGPTDLLTKQACILLLNEKNLKKTKKKTSVILIAKLSHFNVKHIYFDKFCLKISK